MIYFWPCHLQWSMSLIQLNPLQQSEHDSAFGDSAAFVTPARASYFYLLYYLLAS